MGGGGGGHEADKQELRNCALACRWWRELAGAGAGEEVKRQAEQIASGGLPGAHPTPSEGMAGDAGRPPRQAAGGVGGERHPAGFHSGVPVRPE